MKHLLDYAFLLLLAPLAVACSSDDADGTVGEVTDITEPSQELAVSELGLTAAQQGMVPPLNEFSLSLFRQLSQQAGERSTVLSPLGVAAVLGMIGEGAESSTLRELTSALGFADAGKDAVTALFRRLLTALPAADDQVSLSMANVAVANSSACTLQDAYCQTLETGYDAAAWSLDFGQPDALRAVNAWVSEHSHGLITSITDELDPKVILSLLNAIYFKAAWSEPFDPNASSGSVFFGEEEQRFIQMVYRHSEMTYAEQPNGTKALRLPLAGGRYAMTLVLPPADKSLAACLKDIDASWLQSLPFGQYDVEARIPVFTTSADIDLMALLPALGVRRMFDKDEAELLLIPDDSIYYYYGDITL